MTITYINCAPWLGQSSLLWGYFFFKMVTNPFLPSPPINNLIIVHHKYISFSSNRTTSLNGHPRVTLEFIKTNENITMNSTQEQELRYYWVMHLKNVCMVIKRDSLLLSLSLINRMQSWILGFQTVYLPLLIWPDCAAALGCQPDLNTYIQDLRDILKTKLKNFVFLTLKKNCVQVWRVKKMHLVGSSIKRSIDWKYRMFTPLVFQGTNILDFLCHKSR